ncbi:MAG: HAMP domain-containing protein [Chloroflexi bacterium]|nr:HAMP domain-containing protein [Chloroflexota bacterium]
MSIRLRLTLWYTTILTAVITLFGLVVWSALAFSLTNQIDQRLRQTALQLLRASTVVPIRDLSILSIPKLETFQADDIYIQVVYTNGKVSLASENLGQFNRPLDPNALGGAATITEVYLGEAHIRVLTQPILSEGQLLGYLQVGARLREVDQVKNLLLLVLITVGSMSVALSAGVVTLTVGRALKPLDTVTNAALQITRADDLSRRVPHTGPTGDEVGRLVAAFNATLERIEKLFTAQRRFLADVSHELRTPLTAIRGNVDLLRRMMGNANGSEANRESLDAIQSEAERMSRLVGDLLMLAQAESGNLPLARAEVELDTLLLEVYQQGRVLAGSKVSVSLGEEDQARAIGDRDKLKQVLLNLVTNAIKYTPAGGKVTLGLACINGWARFTVTDTGVGIPPEDLHQVFERFYRVDKSRTRAAGTPSGAGLGLSIARWIAQAHGGRLEVSSQIGSGSCFSLWLPLAETRPLSKPAIVPARPG